MFQRKEERDSGASSRVHREGSLVGSSRNSREDDDAPMEAKLDSRELAESLLAALDGGSPEAAGLEHAIRLELLVSALEDATRPRDVSDLSRVLQRIAVGEVANAFVLIVRRRAKTEPNLLLADLARRKG